VVYGSNPQEMQDRRIYVLGKVAKPGVYTLKGDVPILHALFLAGGVAAAAAPQSPTVRLPAGVRPVGYQLDLTIVPAAAPFSGRVAIALAIERPTTTIWLNATDLAIDGAELAAGGAKTRVTVTPGAPGFVGFTLPHAIGPGAATLTVRYHGTMDSQKSRGIYRQNEGPGADDWYAYTFFEPIDARRAFPCFDEPGFKVPWQVTLHVEKSHVALGNAPVQAETPEPNGMKAVRLAPTKPLPSYLVAFVVGPFDIVDGGKGGRAHTPIRFIVPRGRGGETRYARSVTPKIVSLLEDYFDMPYPFGKLDVAVVPRYWGTMEHPGLVALGQPLTLIKPTEEGLHRKQSYANIAIHELAHYWFGDYVTCRWWDDVWLNESLGTWMDGKITDALAPEWKFTLGRDGGRMETAMHTDALPTARKLRLPVESNDAIGNSFENGITYFKGSSVVRMIEHWVGAEKFRGAMRGYVRAHAWGNADANDFLTALRQHLGAPAAEVMASFVEQPGVPLVSVTARCDGGKARVTLAQRRFFADGKARGATARWHVPVCLKYGSDGGVAEECVELTQATQDVTLPSCPRWVMPNADGAGYYRTRYDRASLRALAGVFDSALTVRERVQLAGDVAAVTDAGELPLGDALALLPKFLGDADPRVFGRGVALLTLVRPNELAGAERAAFGRAVEKLLGARGQAVGWAPAPGEDPDVSSLRPQLLRMLADYAHDRGVIAEAQKLADRWLADRKAVAPDMAGTVLGIAALGGDAGYFDRLLAEAHHTHDRRERGLLLRALGEFRAPALQTRALALVAGDAFDLRESLAIARGSLYEPEQRDRTWKFLEQHWDAITGRMRDDEAMWLFGSVPSAFCDAKHRREVAAFLGPRAKARVGAPHAVAEALDRARTCERSVARNRRAVSTFLRQF
jgi:aminopeptidase N